MNLQQKKEFPIQLQSYLNNTYNSNLTTESDTFKYLSQLSIAERRGIWTVIAMALNASQLQVHDYYHNTWSKKFYDNLKEFDKEILRRCQNFSLENEKSAIQQIAQQFKLDHPELNIHSKSLIQIIGRSLQKSRKFPQKIVENVAEISKPRIQFSVSIPVIKSNEDLTAQISKVIQIQEINKADQKAVVQSRKPSASDLICFKDESLKQLDWQQFVNLL